MKLVDEIKIMEREIEILNLPELEKEFFKRNTEEVARDLLGKVLVKIEKERVLSGRIVEVEAYYGMEDPGSHAFKGPTRRNTVMFGPAGIAYIYLCYGMHYLFNVVTEREGIPGAVLIRAAEPLTGVDIMIDRRGTNDKYKLLSGPARLTQAFNIDISYNKKEITGTSKLYIVNDWYNVAKISRSSRIGITYIEGDRNRLFVEGSEYLSTRG